MDARTLQYFQSIEMELPGLPRNKTEQMDETRLAAELDEYVKMIASTTNDRDDCCGACNCG